MLAIVLDQPGGAEVLHLGEVPAPALEQGCVRLRVAAAGVNRADLLQRRGLYPPPPGASPLLGLECAGVVVECAAGVVGWHPGDRAMALLAGGGYAEEVVVPDGQLLPVPAHLSLVEAAAVPEAFVTAYHALFEIGGLASGGWALVHGGSGGVGTAAIQLVRASDAHVAVTAGSQERCDRCRELGADAALDRHDERWPEAVRRVVPERGVDVVLDHVGGPTLASNLELLGAGGRLVLIGLMGGSGAEVDLRRVLTRHLSLHGTTLRSRPAAEKAALVERFAARFGRALEEGRIAPVVDTVLPLARAGEAHRRMAAGGHFGKLVLEVGTASCDAAQILR